MVAEALPDLLPEVGSTNGRVAVHLTASLIPALPLMRYLHQLRVGRSALLAQVGDTAPGQESVLPYGTSALLASH